jgi:hypothetical protein
MLKTLDPFRFLLISVAGWMTQQQQHAIEYLREETASFDFSSGAAAFGLPTTTAAAWPDSASAVRDVISPPLLLV